MMIRSFIRTLLSLLILISISVAACTAADNPGPIIIDEDAGEDVDDGLFDAEDTTDIEFEEEFEKPSYYAGDQLEEIYTIELMNALCDSETTMFRRRTLGARPHMMSTSWAKESWLYPGEYFVIDLGSIECNRWWMPVEYYVMAFHEGERLPIRGIVVDEEFPPMEAIESWDEDEFSSKETVFRDRNVPFNYTVVIPPWAFPENGAYNVQVLAYPKWEPRPDLPFLLMKSIKVGPITAEPHTSHTIYYGSTKFDDSSDKFRDRTDEAVKWESPVAGRFVYPINLMYLAPPTEIYDWEEFDIIYDATLTEIMEVPEPTVTLKFYTTGMGLESPHSDTRGTNMYYLFRDDEIIDIFLLDPGEVPLIDLMNLYDEGVVLPIEVDLTEEVAAFHLVAVPWPFQPHIRNSDLGVGMTGNVPASSNALLLKYSPE